MSAQHTPAPWVTDGRYIVQEKDGRSFWPGQPFILDCGISQAVRGEENTKANAAFICKAVNCHDELFEALEDVASGCTVPKERLQRLLAKAKGEA